MTYPTISFGQFLSATVTLQICREPTAGRERRIGAQTESLKRLMMIKSLQSILGFDERHYGGMFDGILVPRVCLVRTSSHMPPLHFLLHLLRIINSLVENSWYTYKASSCMSCLNTLNVISFLSDRNSNAGQTKTLECFTLASLENCAVVDGATIPYPAKR